MWTRKQLKTAGKAAFRANYWRCVGVSLILLILMTGGASTSTGGANVHITAGNLQQQLTAAASRFAGIGSLLSLAVIIFINNPLKVGCSSFYVKNSKAPCGFNAVLDGLLNGNFLNNVLGTLMSRIFIFLWGLLFIIPGVMKAYSYRMVPYILADDPTVEWRDALNRSKQMMRGNRFAAFVLDLSFIGWNIVSIFTLGLLHFFYIAPYKDAVNAELYRTLSAPSVEREYL